MSANVCAGWRGLKTSRNEGRFFYVRRLHASVTGPLAWRSASHGAVIRDRLLDAVAIEGAELLGECGLEGDGGEVIRVAHVHREVRGMRSPTPVNAFGVSEGSHQDRPQICEQGKLFGAEPTVVIEEALAETATHRENSVDGGAIRVVGGATRSGEGLIVKPTGKVRFVKQGLQRAQVSLGEVHAFHVPLHGLQNDERRG